MNTTDPVTLLRGESKNDSLQKKVDFAIRLLRSIPTEDGPVEISYSGGKDSDVILELAKMAGIPYRAIYKNTTIDPPGTIKHCKEKGVEVFAPTINFFDLVKKKGLSSPLSKQTDTELQEWQSTHMIMRGGFHSLELALCRMWIFGCIFPPSTTQTPRRNEKETPQSRVQNSYHVERVFPQQRVCKRTS